MAQKPLVDAPIEITEIDQASNLVATYITSSSVENGSRIDVVVPQYSNSYAKSILNAFLPAGYPHSVTSDYLEYQIYVRILETERSSSLELRRIGLVASLLKLYCGNAII